MFLPSLKLTLTKLTCLVKILSIVELLSLRKSGGHTIETGKKFQKVLNSIVTKTPKVVYQEHVEIVYISIHKIQNYYNFTKTQNL